MSPVLFPRQTVVEDDDNNGNWWFSSTAFIVKWAILAALVLFFFAWFVGGYFHARARLRKGLPPMKYHRFLVPVQQRPYVPNGPQNQFSFYRVDDQSYAMNAMPPPVYDPNTPPPPTYQMNGMSKIDPNQSYDAPPVGYPPQELPPREPKKKTKWNIIPFL